MIRDLLLKGAAAGGVLFLLFVVAPMTLRVAHWLGDDTPSVAEACAHLGAVLGGPPPDCELHVGADAERYEGEVRSRYLHCLNDAADPFEVEQCTDVAYVFGYQKRRREQERLERAQAP